MTCTGSITMFHCIRCGHANESKRRVVSVDFLNDARTERDRYREALSAIEIYARAPHEKIAEACGVDVCTACLIHGTAAEALRADVNSRERQT